MISRIVCFIWGHKIREFITDELNEFRQPVKGHWVWLKRCTRCGAKLV